MDKRLILFVFLTLWGSLLFALAPFRMKEIYVKLKKYDEKSPTALKQKKAINQYFLLDEMAAFAVEDIIHKMNPAQRVEYKKLMLELLQKTIYEDTAKKLKKGKVTFQKILKISDSIIREKTSIYLKDENLNLRNDYDFKKVKNQYKVIDIYLDDSSLMEDYKNQFTQIEALYGIDKNENSLLPRLRRAVLKVEDWDTLTTSEEKTKSKKKQEKRPVFID